MTPSLLIHDINLHIQVLNQNSTAEIFLDQTLNNPLFRERTRSLLLGDQRLWVSQILSFDIDLDKTTLVLRKTGN